MKITKSLGIILPLALLSSIALGGEKGHRLSLDQIRSLDQSSHMPGSTIYDGGSKDSLRWKAVRSAALSAGAQYGFIERTEELRQLFQEQSDMLDSIFDFNAIMKMASNEENQMFFLPPVIQEAKNVIAVSEDSKTVRVSGKLYEIKREARLTLRAPNWRQYLILTNTGMEPELPNRALLPRTPAEKSRWQEWVFEGWRAGYAQAEEEMRVRIRHLGEDFVGMVRYMRLVDEGKIKQPNIATLKQNVAGDGATLRENEAIYQLNMPARFNHNADDWNPLYGESRGSLRLPIEPTGR